MVTESAIPWRGFHHVAIVTPDLDTTIGFYRDVLAMGIGEIIGTGIGAGGRHCFIKPGESDTWGLHFFENRDSALANDLATAKHTVLDSGWRPGFLPGVMQHVAFALPNEQAALALRERLERHGVTMTSINTIGPIRNFLFMDNHGLLLEATWPSK